MHLCCHSVKQITCTFTLQLSQKHELGFTSIIVQGVSPSTLMTTTTASETITAIKTVFMWKSGVHFAIVKTGKTSESCRISQKCSKVQSHQEVSDLLLLPEEAAV